MFSPRFTKSRLPNDGRQLDVRRDSAPSNTGVETSCTGCRSAFVAQPTLYNARVSVEAPEARFADGASQGRKAGIAREVRRMVLFPFGQPRAPEHRGLCADFAMRCNGDLERFIDAPVDTVAQFALHVSRIRGLRDGSERALVVMTLTRPLRLAVIGGRTRLESQVPWLRSALWMIYVDPEEDPFFVSTAERLGTFSGPLNTAPIWVGPGFAQFIVASPLVTNLHRVADRVREIAGGCPEPSRFA